MCVFLVQRCVTKLHMQADRIPTDNQQQRHVSKIPEVAYRQCTQL